MSDDYSGLLGVVHGLLYRVDEPGLDLRSDLTVTVASARSETSDEIVGRLLGVLRAASPAEVLGLLGWSVFVAQEKE